MTILKSIALICGLHEEIPVVQHSPIYVETHFSAFFNNTHEDNFYNLKKVCKSIIVETICKVKCKR